MGIEGTQGLLRPEGDNYPVTPWQGVFLSSRAGTIYSGTSEIQRNIIGARTLGGRLYGPGTYYETEVPPQPRIHVDAAALTTPPLMLAPSGVVTVAEDAPGSRGSWTRRRARSSARPQSASSG